MNYSMKKNRLKWILFISVQNAGNGAKHRMASGMNLIMSVNGFVQKIVFLDFELRRCTEDHISRGHGKIK